VGTGFSPLDQTLELLPYTSLTPSLLAGAIRLGARLPFAQAAEELAYFTGVQLSAETVRRWTEAAGAVQLEQETAALAQLLRTLPEPPAGPACQQLSADGAMVPLVGGSWTEVKTLVLGTVHTNPAAPRHTSAWSYFARCAAAEDFSWQATLETHRRGTSRAGTVVAVQDGAVWLQGLVDLQRPDAVRILDFAHAVEHLGQVAQALFGTGTLAASEWLGQQAHTLRHGDPAAVVQRLAVLEQAIQTGQQAVAQPDAGEVVAACSGYLGQRLAQLQYRQFAAAGYPIGSGSVESAHKLLVEARLKGSGMHWTVANVNRLLVLRCLLHNGRWAEGWPALWRGLHARQWTPAIPAAPPTVAVAAPPVVEPPDPPAPQPPRPKLMVNGKPTKDHPWRRCSPFRAKP
jgi:hypothetical protein